MHRAGDTVSVSIFRGQRRLNVRVTLSDAKDAASDQST
jgi:S1-C subfamily serine protease